MSTVYLEAPDITRRDTAIERFRKLNCHVDMGNGNAFRVKVGRRRIAETIAHELHLHVTSRKIAFPNGITRKTKALDAIRREQANLSQTIENQKALTGAPLEKLNTWCPCGKTRTTAGKDMSWAVHKRFCPQWKDFIQRNQQEILADLETIPAGKVTQRWNIGMRTLEALCGKTTAKQVAKEAVQLTSPTNGLADQLWSRITAVEQENQKLRTKLGLLRKLLEDEK